MMEFKIGDLIRNKKPYLGEAAKLIVGEDETQLHVICGPGKMGYFDFPKHREIIFKSQKEYYHKANLFEVLFLTVWGWLTSRRRK